MAREVDRLLEQLAGIGRPAGEPRMSSSAPRPRISRVSSPSTGTRAGLAGLWARAALAAILGVLMTQWPYPRACGLPLAGYLGAVAMVLVGGGWVAVASWKQRNAAAHVLALLILLWGIALAAERVLPRTGYAAARASWGCH